MGWDYSLGVAYRPLLINNVTMTFGAATLKPGRGFRDIYTDKTRDCPPNLIEFCTPDNVNINPLTLNDASKLSWLFLGDIS